MARTDPSSLETARERGQLVNATGDVDLPPSSEEFEHDEDDYMAH